MMRFRLSAVLNVLAARAMLQTQTITGQTNQTPHSDPPKSEMPEVRLALGTKLEVRGFRRSRPCIPT
jgi:hypothetical protein